MYLGVDVGGTKIELCRFDADFRLLDSSRVATDTLFPKGLSFATRLIDLIGARIQANDRGIGVAMKGLVHDGTVTFGSLLGGEVHYPLQAELAKRLALPITVFNDLFPLLFAEKTFGCTKDVEHFTVVNLGTGLSIATYNRGVVDGFRSCAGQMTMHRWYIPELGREESVERLASGAGLADTYREIAGSDLSAEAVFKHSDSDPHAATVTRLFIKYLARLLVEISYFCNPRTIVLQGSLVRSAGVYLEPLLREYEAAVDPYSRAERVLVSEVQHANCLGAVIGAFGTGSHAKPASILRDS